MALSIFVIVYFGAGWCHFRATNMEAFSLAQCGGRPVAVFDLITVTKWLGLVKFHRSSFPPKASGLSSADWTYYDKTHPLTRQVFSKADTSDITRW